jgi:hypothetical protein
LDSFTGDWGVCGRWIPPAEFRGARFRAKVKRAVNGVPKGDADDEGVYLANSTGPSRA